MAYDEALASRVRALLADRPAMTERKMFGGWALMLGGNMCCGVHKDTLIVRLPAAEWEDALKEPNATAFEMTGRTMRGFVVVDSSGLGDDEVLRTWLERAASYAAALPAK